MENKKQQQNILNQFFCDKNVRFPQCPKLVDGIHVYEAPKGLGIQFRGGTEKFLLKGADSYKIWQYLKTVLDGTHTLEEILCEGRGQYGLDGVNVGTFLKTLHSYHLLVPESIAESGSVEMHFDLFSEKQTQYYDRVVPLSGLNKDGKSVLERIYGCKVLLITDEILAPFMSFQMQMAGFKDLGFLVVSNNETDNIKDYICDQINIMTYENISGLSTVDVRNVLSQKMSDYQYVLTALGNPSMFFLNEISRMCTHFNRPMLSISVKDNNYEVGPFYFPEMESPCISCYNLREQSYRRDAVYEYIYQEGLRIEDKFVDDKIKGFDYNSLAIVVNMAICQLKNALATVSQPKLIGSVFKFNSLNYTMSIDNFFKVPGCPSCSNVNKK